MKKAMFRELQGSVREAGSILRGDAVASRRTVIASTGAGLEAMPAAAKELDAMVAGWGASEEELMPEIVEIRRAARAEGQGVRDSALADGRAKEVVR